MFACILSCFSLQNQVDVPRSSLPSSSEPAAAAGHEAGLISWTDLPAHAQQQSKRTHLGQQAAGVLQAGCSDSPPRPGPADLLEPVQHALSPPNQLPQQRAMPLQALSTQRSATGGHPMYTPPLTRLRNDCVYSSASPSSGPTSAPPSPAEADPPAVVARSCLKRQRDSSAAGQPVFDTWARSAGGSDSKGGGGGEWHNELLGAAVPRRRRSVQVPRTQC